MQRRTSACARAVRLAFAALLVSALGAPASAQTNGLVRVGPVGPDGFPFWYLDSNGLSLERCLDVNDPLCAFEADAVPNPGAPISFPDNFPDEALYWGAEAEMTTSEPEDGRALLILALEAAFAEDEIVDGDQVVFGRVRIRIDLAQPGLYRVIHPFGVDEFDVITPGRRAINFTEDISEVVGDFAGALGSRIGPFLTWDPITDAPPGYVGDPNVLHAVTGSPFGTNFFRIEGPNVRPANSPNVCPDDPSTNCMQTSLFSLMGKMTVTQGVGVDRATYARSADGATQLELFANSGVGQQLVASGAGIPDTTLIGEDFRYFNLIDVAAVPSQVTVTNITDSPETSATRDVTDLVLITRAEYDLSTQQLLVSADSSDLQVPPTLTVDDFGPLTDGTAIFQPVMVPPAKVTVRSSYGGVTSAPVRLVNNGFTGPAVTSLTPGAGLAGASFNATILGANFDASSTCSLGADVAITCTFVSATQLDAQITIDAGAIPGPRNLTVTSATGSATLPGALQVLPPVDPTGPTITALSPAQGQVGESLNAVITGTNFILPVDCSLGAGVTVACTLVSNTQINMTITIAPTAVPGPRTLIVNSLQGTASLVDGFEVLPAPPAFTLTGISPAEGIVGETVNAVISGTNFTAPVSCSLGAGVTVACALTAPDRIDATILVGLGATPGPRTLTVTTGSGTASLPDAFTVLPLGPALPTATSIFPTQGNTGATVGGIINGINFDATTTCSLGDGVTTTCTFLSTTLMSVSITIDSAAAPGLRTLAVSNTSGTTFLPNAFLVIAPPQAPTVSGISPAQGTAGETLAVTILGSQFSGVTTCSLGAGITVTCTPINAISLAATVVIDPSAAPGPRDLTVTTPSGSALLANAFEVLPAGPSALFSDDFNRPDAQDLGPNWTCSDECELEGGVGSMNDEGAFALVNASIPADQTVRARIRLDGSSRSGILARASNDSWYLFRIREGSNQVQLVRFAAGRDNTLASANVTINRGEWYELELTVSGSSPVSVRASLNGVPVIDIQDTSPRRVLSGSAGVFNGRDRLLQFDDFEVTSP